MTNNKRGNRLEEIERKNAIQKKQERSNVAETRYRKKLELRCEGILRMRYYTPLKKAGHIALHMSIGQCVGLSVGIPVYKNLCNLKLENASPDRLKTGYPVIKGQDHFIFVVCICVSQTHFVVV